MNEETETNEENEAMYNVARDAVWSKAKRDIEGEGFVFDELILKEARSHFDSFLDEDPTLPEALRYAHTLLFFAARRRAS